VLDVRKQKKAKKSEFCIQLYAKYAIFTFFEHISDIYSYIYIVKSQ